MEIFPQIGVKKTNILNHHLDEDFIWFDMDFIAFFGLAKPPNILLMFQKSG